MSSVEKYKTCPRLYANQPLGQDSDFELSAAQCHYLKNVLRKTEGDDIRVFNGHDGEWIYRLVRVAKKNGNAEPLHQIVSQPDKNGERILVFAPLKKNETDMVIEKGTELGVTCFMPVLCDYSNTRKIRKDRMENIAIEAAEQCERMDVPCVHDLRPLSQALDFLKSQGDVHIFAALERIDTGTRPKMKGNIAIVIGPEGGFSSDEKTALTQEDYIKALSLGPRVLRAETAAIVALAGCEFLR